jgi:NAD(P)-binding Rossmann-like domain
MPTPRGMSYLPTTVALSELTQLSGAHANRDGDRLPNGLSAAIVLAAAGLATTVFERNVQIGGACSTAETTLLDFRQDLGSSVYSLGVASPFFRSLPINIPWIEPPAPCAFEHRQFDLAQERLGKLGLRIERLPGGHLATNEQPAFER